MFCKNCGKECDENAFVCLGCGCELVFEKQNEKEKTKDKSNDDFLLRIFIMVSFGLSCIVLSLYFMPIADVINFIVITIAFSLAIAAYVLSMFSKNTVMRLISYCNIVFNFALFSVGMFYYIVL